jgi:hypothetical protein
MIEGLDYAIQVLERGAARHKFYASGDFSNASEDVKVRHLNQMEACLGAVKLLKRKRSQYIKERRKTVRAQRPVQQPQHAICTLSGGCHCTARINILCHCTRKGKCPYKRRAVR